MIIDLQRAFTPEEMGEEKCGLCRRDFRVESVRADAVTDSHAEMGLVCRECIAYFGRANPVALPTIEEFQAFVERYPEPMFPSEEALEASEGIEGRHWPAYEQSLLWTPRG